MARLDRHVLVCVHERPEGHPRGCCARRGGRELADALRAACHAAGLRRVVRVNEVACLDQCAQGASVVVYPEGVWYGRVDLADVDEILREHLRDGRPVQRLRLHEDELNGRGLTVREAWTEDAEQGR